MVLRMTVGLVLTAVAFAIAGRRLWWLKRLAFSGQPAPEAIAAVRTHPGRDVAVEATEVVGQRKLLKWSVPGAAHALTFWGFIGLAADDHRGLRGAVLPDVRHPADRALGVHRVHRGPVRRGGAGRDHHLRRDPAAQRPASRGPQVAVLRLAHRRGVAGPRPDLPGHRYPADLPGRADQHRRVPLRARRVRLADRRALAGAAGLRGEQRAGGGVPPGPDRGDPGVRWCSWCTPSTCISSWPR